MYDCMLDGEGSTWEVQYWLVFFLFSISKVNVSLDIAHITYSIVKYQFVVCVSPYAVQNSPVDSEVVAALPQIYSIQYY